MTNITNKELKNALLSKLQNDEENLESVIESFGESFPNYEINNLIYVSDFEIGGEHFQVFSLKNKKLVLTDDSSWYEIPTIYLSTKKHKNKEYNINLLKNSSETITYELYPFEQCRTIPLNFIISEKTIDVEGEECELPNIDIFLKKKNKNAIKYKWTDNLYLYVYSDHKKNYTMYYYIIENDKIISGFTDPETNFQEGDYSTNCFVTEDKKTLIIENNGDVQSIVIIRNNN